MSRGPLGAYGTSLHAHPKPQKTEGNKLSWVFSARTCWCLGPRTLLTEALTPQAPTPGPPPLRVLWPGSPDVLPKKNPAQCSPHSRACPLRWLYGSKNSPWELLSGLCMSFQQTHWRPTPVLLPGKSHGWRSLVGCSPWGRKESDTTEQLHFHFSLSCVGEGNGNPFQCSCLENPRDGGAWWAAVYGVAQSRTRLTRLSNSSSSMSFQSAGGNARRARLWEARSASLPWEDTMRTRPGPCRGRPHTSYPGHTAWLCSLTSQRTKKGQQSSRSRLQGGLGCRAGRPYRPSGTQAALGSESPSSALHLA